ncbi:MAG: adenylate kinase [Acutalibacteraceae bacterium]
MIILITGASHTGKTYLSQMLLEKFKYPYLSIDHLKMGLIRSGQTTLTPEDDDKLTDYLWPIVREIAKTAIENKQNLIIEGCYIPYDWKNHFSLDYLSEIKYICLVMSENYIKKHFQNIKKFANVLEARLDDSYCTMESMLEENAKVLRMCQVYQIDYLLIDDEYNVDAQLKSVLER